jgi:GNAT superfamily N-acetyltransferase
MSPTPGSHLLGPHVVGQRVVIRRILPGETGPSGGPAMTDVLGICVSWTATEAVVRREDGSLVSMDVAQIISGKPVPLRPSIRHRVQPAEAHRRSLALWPDLQTEALGTWTLRGSAGSPQRRANSVLAFTDPGVQHPVERVTAWYAGRGTRPIACVLPDSPEEALFRYAGWVPEDAVADTEFLVASVAHALRSSSDTSGLDVAEDGPVAIARVGAIASGAASFADDWLGLRSIAVDQDHRRQGHGTAIVSALLEWGAERGARTAYLQVFADNEPALALYAKLGFSVHHTYRYLAAPPERPDFS